MLFAEPSKDKTETVFPAMLDTTCKMEDVLSFHPMLDTPPPTNIVLFGKEQPADNVPLPLISMLIEFAPPLTHIVLDLKMDNVWLVIMDML
jgi:hypothetical protein